MLVKMSDILAGELAHCFGADVEADPDKWKRMINAGVN